MTRPQIEALDLFSAAAGGWSLGMHRAGYTTIAACEVEAWRRALYSENNPDVKVYDDVRTLTAERLLADLGRLPGIVVGSPPCQDISSANTKGKGVEGDRSSLYFDAIRIIGEIRDLARDRGESGARWFALENSANLRTRGYDAVRAAVEAIGYACWPCVVRAGDIGANHDRARAWLIGCDLEQVADADGFGRDEGWGRGWSGFDVSVPLDPCDADEAGLQNGEMVRSVGCAPFAAAGTNASWGRGDAADAHRQLPNGRPEQPGAKGKGSHLSSNGAVDRDSGGEDGAGALPWGHGGVGAAGNAPNPDQARQAHGCMESSLRQAEISDDGCGAGRSDDGSCAGQMGVRAPDRGDAVSGPAGWSLADLADHLRLDDGLSTRLAGQRVAVGGPKGTSAASLVVEAFGDAVIPQIPEAIGRAIHRVETAMAALHGKVPA